MNDFLNDSRFSSIVDVLHYRADRHPERRAFTFLGDGVTETTTMSYGDLEARASGIATCLRERCLPGDRALLLYAPGLDFIAAFFGCLSAGIVAVPAYPPRRNRMMSRLQSIVSDASPALVLSTRSILQGVATRGGEAPELAALPWLTTDADDVPMSAVDGAPVDRSPVYRGRLALLQYTSGSTSAPKGVMVTHGNLLHNSECIRRSFELTPESVGVSWLPGYHDMGLIDGILQPVYSGFPACIMAPASFIEQPIRWLRAISTYRATHSGGPNFAYALCADRTTPEQRDGLDLSCWSSAYNGAEPIHLLTLRRFEEVFARHGFQRRFFYPCYGLAEGTLMVTGGRVADEPVVTALEVAQLERHKVGPAASTATSPDVRHLVGCGRAGCGTRVVIVDPISLRSCPADSVGEIWVRGASVAAGYWGQPGTTKETFEGRLADTGEGPFLRTGDLGFIQEGELFVTGRLKDMFVIRGNNHYPQDIELTAERSHPALRIGCAAAFTAAGSESEQLVVVVEVERSALRGLDVEGIAGAVRAAIAEEHDLSAYAVVLLSPGTIPKTSSGKIQRRVCRAEFLEGALREVGRSILRVADRSLAMPLSDHPSTSPGAEPEALLTRRVLRVVARTLRVALSASDTGRRLIELGIDSMTAVELQHRLQKEFGIVPSQVDLLRRSSVESIVRSLMEPAVTSTEPEPVTVPADLAGAYPLSRGQQSLWFIHQMAPSSAAYNVSFAARIGSALNVPLLREALRLTVARHPSLRTTFDSVNGSPMQRVRPEAEPELTLIDAAECGGPDLDSRLAAAARLPFDLKAAPPIRVYLYAVGSDEYVLHLTAHHIIVDYRSLTVLLDDLRAAYDALLRGRSVVLPPVAWTPAHFVQWQHRTLQGPRGEHLWAYWQRQLQDVASDASLLTDMPRPPVQSFAGETLDVRLGRLTHPLRSLARAEGTTLYVVMLAAFQVLLHRYVGDEDVVVGTSVSGRSRPELARMVGYVANQVVLRGRLRGEMSVRDLIAHLDEVVVGAIEHQDYPFSMLVERLRPDRDPGRTALFQVMFAYEKSLELDAATDGRLGFERIDVRQGTAQFDLTLNVLDAADEVTVSWNYGTDLFERGTIERMSAHFLLLLESIVGGGDSIDAPIASLRWQSAEERGRLMAWGGSRPVQDPMPGGTIRSVHRWFETQVERTPGAPAVRSPEQELRYDELNARANSLADRLRRLGVAAEVPVGICMRRTAGMMIALLAVLKAGGAYVPLDPSQPRRRLLHMMEGAGVRVVLTASDLSGRLPGTGATVLSTDRSWEEYAGGDAGNPVFEILPDSPAYVMFTSGSTGVPKGVIVTHRALASYLEWAVRNYGMAGGEGAPVISSISFDATITALFLPLLAGGCVWLLPELREIESLCDALREGADFSLVKITPAQLDLLTPALAGEATRGRIRTLIVGGEALSEPTVEQWRTCRPPVRIINEYGPTEAVVGCSAYELDESRSPSGRVPIGTPIDRAEIHLLDRYLELVPVGVAGEIYIGGPSLARGYVNDPALTAGKFIPHPFRSGERLYRSGDRARRLPDGTLEYLGRVDEQIKIRGVRIEPGEIEGVLRLHPGVGAALVMLRRDDGVERLVAYVVPREATAGPTAHELHDWMVDRLPGTMVPSTFVMLVALPLTRHGKIDRRALPSPDRHRSDPRAPGAAPVTEIESIIAAIWRQALHLDAVGVDENFFELGGHSLLAAEVHGALEKQLRRRLPIIDLLQYPTIASLARHLNGDVKATADVASIRNRILKRTGTAGGERTERVRTEGKNARLPSIVPVRRDGPFPLSFAQEKFWSLEQSVPGNSFSNLCTAIHISGPLDTGILQRVVDEIVRRHEVLRTSFAVVGERPMQMVESGTSFPLLTIDLLDRPGQEREELFFQHAIREFHHSFDFARAPLWRVTLIRLVDSEYVVLLTMHHIISDSWSLQQISREIVVLYQAFHGGTPSPLADLAVRFTDYAVWQNDVMGTDPMSAQLDYWMRRLGDGSFVPLTLPGSRARPTAQSFRTSRRTIRMPGPESTALKDAGYAEGCTPFMTLLTAFKMLLHGLTGDEEIRIGTIVANRNHAGIEEVVGLFLNTVLLRTDLSGNPTLRDVLHRVRTGVLEAYDNQDIPFEEVVRGLERRGDLVRSSLFQILFLFDSAPPDAVEMCGLKLKTLDVKKMVDTRITVTTFDMIVTFTDGPDGLSGTLIYKDVLFDEPVIDHLLSCFQEVIRRLASNPELRLAELRGIAAEVDGSVPGT